MHDNSPRPSCPSVTTGTLAGRAIQHRAISSIYSRNRVGPVAPGAHHHPTLRATDAQTRDKERHRMSVFRLAAPWTLLSWGVLVCALTGYVRFVTVADSRGVSSGPAHRFGPPSMPPGTRGASSSPPGPRPRPRWASSPPTRNSKRPRQVPIRLRLLSRSSGSVRRGRRGPACALFWAVRVFAWCENCQAAIKPGADRPSARLELPRSESPAASHRSFAGDNGKRRPDRPLARSGR